MKLFFWTLLQAFKELRNQKKFALFFTLNLGLGLLGLITLFALQDSLQEALEGKSREYLSADFSFSTRRVITPEELKEVEGHMQAQNFHPEKRSRLVGTLSMALAKGESRLMNLRAVDEAFPLFGKITLEGRDGVVQGRTEDLQKSSEVWIYPEVAEQLQVKIGDDLKIGELTFKVSHLVKNDTTDGAQGFSIAPRLYMGIAQLEKTGLIRKGSTLFDNYYYLFKKGEATRVRLKELKVYLDQKIQDMALRFTTPEESSEQVGRLLSYLTDYLGLALLVAFFLSGIGGGFLFQNFLKEREKGIAILLSLGHPLRLAYLLYLVELFILGFISATCALGVSLVILPILCRYLGAVGNVQLTAHWSATTILLSYFLGCLGSILLCLPHLRGLSQVSPLSLLSSGTMKPVVVELSFFKQLRHESSKILLYLPATATFWGLSILVAHSFKVGSFFIGGLLLALIVLGGLFRILLIPLKALVAKRGPSQAILLRLLLGNLIRRSASSLGLFVALGTAGLLVTIIPVLKSSIQKDLERPEGKNIPTLFLFDMERAQIEPLGELTKKFGVELSDVSPLVRGRLIQLNGENFEKGSENGVFTTRENEEAKRQKGRGLNLTYSLRADPEKLDLLEGRQFTPGKIPTGEKDDPLELAVEKRFAQRMGFKVGDELRVDIQGVELWGKVISLRNVKWTSFRPNFFNLASPQSLTDAPQTYLAVILGLTSSAQEKTRNQLQYEITKVFPNIAVIDLSQSVRKLFSLIDQVSGALEVMALFTLFVGLCVLFSIAHNEALRQEQELNLLKVLGADSKDLILLMIMQFGGPAFLSSSFGVLLGISMAWVITYKLFEGIFYLAPLELFGFVGLITFLSVLVAFVASLKVAYSSPKTLLG